MRQLTETPGVGGTRGYDTAEERRQDIKQLEAEGFDNFTLYRDTHAVYAVQYGKRLETEHAELTVKRDTAADTFTSADEKRLKFLSICIKRRDDQPSVKSPQHGWMVRHPGYDPMH